MITLAAVSHSVMSTPVLMAVKEFTDLQLGVEWANEQAWRWVRNSRRIAAECGGDGEFVIDGIASSALQDDGSDVPYTFFGALTDELFIQANQGEELFIVAVDEATLGAGNN